MDIELAPAGDTFDDYMRKAREVKQQQAEWRWGQTLFNVLYAIRPDLCDKVHMMNGGDLDPFYDNRVVDKFLAYVEASW